MKPYWKFLIVVLIGIAIDETIGLFLLLFSTYIVFAKSLAEQTDGFWPFCRYQILRAGGTGVGAFVAARLYHPRPMLAAAVVGIISFLFILTTFLINVNSLDKWPTLTFARFGVMLLRIPAALLGGYLVIRFWPKKNPSSSEDEKKGRYRKFLDWLFQYFPRLALLFDAEKVRKFIRRKLPPGGTASDGENEQHPPQKNENDSGETP